jgi:hypothetical protein
MVRLLSTGKKKFPERVGKSRKDMVGLLTTGKKKSTGKKLEKVERKCKDY